MTTIKRGHCCSRSAFGKVRFSGHKPPLKEKNSLFAILANNTKLYNWLEISNKEICFPLNTISQFRVWHFFYNSSEVVLKS